MPFGLLVLDRLKSLTPGTKSSPRENVLIGVGLTAAGLIIWETLKPTVFPGPLDVVSALPAVLDDGIVSELWSSFSVNMEALALSAAVGLPLAWLARVPIVKPIATFLSKLRFVGSGVFYLPLMLLLPGAHDVKVGLLFLGELFYLVTTMMGVVLNLPEYRFDDAATLRMGPWLSTWYVVVRGTVAESIDAIRDNAAMGWAMLMFVEGLVRSEGGVGVMLLNSQKHTNFDAFFAVLAVILGVGILQDWVIGQVKRILCPYI